MPFRALDTTAIARSLVQVADREGDLADAFFERHETLELAPPEEAAGTRIWREQGFALRLIREQAAWLASRDGIDVGLFADALRQVARVLPAAPYSPPHLDVPAFADAPVESEMQELPSRVVRAIRRRWAGFPLRLRVRRHRRWVRVVGTQLAPEQQTEEFHSFRAETPWGDHGALLATLDAASVERIATSLTSLFRARQAKPVSTGIGPVVLAPAACAVLLHEAVAHALETDTLAQSGAIEAALGVQIGSAVLNVLDNPEGGPPAVARQFDDEGTPVVRRWLLRAGVVEQLLADRKTAHESPVLIAGAGRRSHRHQPPVPRSTHLEVLAGEQTAADLLTDIDQGYWFSEASRGRLDPRSGEFVLHLPWGREIRQGELGDLVAPCRLRGRVSDLLGGVTGIGSDRQVAGAGWCAKGGVKLPVWATTSSMRLEGVEVSE